MIHSANYPQETYTLIGLGTVYFERGQYHRANEVWDEGLKIAEEIGDREVYGILLDNLGAAQLKIKNIAQAVAYLNEAVEVTSEIQDKRTQADVYRRLANVFLALNYITEGHRVM